MEGVRSRAPGRAAILVPVLGTLWGLNWSAVRICLTEIAPWTLRFLAFALAAVFMFGALRLRGVSARVPRAHWWRVIAVGVFSIVAYNMLTAFAQLSATTARTAVLSYTMPVWTVILARLFLGEALDGRRILGLGLGLAGLAALGWPLLAAGELSWGLLFATLSGVGWAIGTTIIKRFPIDADTWAVAAWQLALAAVATAAGMLAFEGVPAIGRWSLPVLLAFAYQVVLAQAVATTLWFVILKRLPAGIAAIGLLMVPAIGVVGAATLLGEHPTAADWLGLALIVAASGAVLVRSPDPARS